MIIENVTTGQPNLTRRVFQVNADGMVRAREVLIDAQQWSDFVFEERYPLMPLNELEIYIDQNGHLPGVPSEDEVLKEGINLAEMNAILLQKIEELTLYLIEQEKRIIELEKAQK